MHVTAVMYVSRGHKADETAAQGDSNCCDQQAETPTRCRHGRRNLDRS